MSIHSSVFNHDSSPNRILHEDHDASHKISKELLGLLPIGKNQPIVFVCIGTDRSTGDSLGPLVGTLLKEKEQHPLPSMCMVRLLSRYTL